MATRNIKMTTSVGSKVRVSPTDMEGSGVTPRIRPEADIKEGDRFEAVPVDEIAAEAAFARALRVTPGRRA